AGANSLGVGNNGREGISVGDLNALQEVEQIPMGPIGPIPLNLNPQFPRSIAASSNAILFSTAPLTAPGVAPGNGIMWQLSRITHAAFPRPNLGINTANSTVNGRDVLIAPDSGSAIVSVEGNGTVRLYDPIADTFTITRTAVFANNTLRGTVSAAPDGSYYVVDNQVFNSV